MMAEPARAAGGAGSGGRWRMALAAVLLAVALIVVIELAVRPSAVPRPVAQTSLPSVSAHAAVQTRAGAARRAAPRASVTGSLSMAQLAGQRIIYAYAGLNPPAALLGAIRAGEAAGVILFGNNIVSRSQLQAVLARFQRASASSPLHAPLLILTDQEGGLVRRLPGAPALSERQIGAGADAARLAATAGAGAGANLAAAGVNVNLAPVLDVFDRPGNFIDQYGRSYSSSPATVAALGSAFITAQQRTGVAATAKHFPGLGTAAQDQNTDLGPVTLNLSLTRLRGVEEAPYRSAIAAGVKLVMVSWATYPALDPRRPAGLSPAVIGGELRGRLGYRGVTISDAIAAGALVRFGSLGPRGVLAARAGADLIICSESNPADNTPADGATVRGAIATALSRGQLSRATAEQAAARVLALRRHP